MVCCNPYGLQRFNSRAAEQGEREGYWLRRQHHAVKRFLELKRLESVEKLNCIVCSD
jgi:hypothetical protein